VNVGLKTLEQLTQQMSAVINEQRCTNRILAELAGEEVYQADEPSHRGSANSSGYSGNGQAANYYSTKSSDEMDIQSQNKLYVGNIDYSATESELEAHFAHFGQVEFVNIPVNRYNGRARGFGFVTFVAKQDAERAMSLNGSEFKGRQIQVNFAKERDSVSQ
jgi:RNA recognition motif-containing protein